MALEPAARRVMSLLALNSRLTKLVMGHASKKRHVEEDKVWVTCAELAVLPFIGLWV